MKTRTVLFGGSFNPIHIGHLIVANYVCEYEACDELWFMVSPQNPLKRHADLLDDEVRLRLVQTATAGYSRFKVSEFEFRMPKPSYTIDTLDALRSAFPEREFSLLIGSDNWVTFPQWREYGRILHTTPLFVYPRHGYPIERQTLPEKVRAIQAPQVEISSSFLRQAIREGRDIRYFLPSEIREETVRLYQAYTKNAAQQGALFEDT